MANIKKINNTENQEINNDLIDIKTVIEPKDKLEVNDLKKQVEILQEQIKILLQ